MKTTNTLLSIITIILIICVADHYSTQWEKNAQERIKAKYEAEIDSARRAIFPETYAAIDSLNRIDK
jgi:sensor domain CHASE-containing protein